MRFSRCRNGVQVIPESFLACNCMLCTTAVCEGLRVSTALGMLIVHKLTRLVHIDWFSTVPEMSLAGNYIGSDSSWQWCQSGGRQPGDWGPSTDELGSVTQVR